MRTSPMKWLAAVALLGLLGCSDKPAPDRCTDVQCQGSTTCDLTDGQCKCGGEGGVVCAPGQSCDVATRTCANPQTTCSGVTCTGGTACDPADGQCKCGGPGGASCGPTQKCDAVTRACVASTACQNVVCASNEACDPLDGQCLCNGATCGPGTVCSGGDAGCVASLCAGVHCLGSMACDPADGLCKCNGSLCGAAEACSCPTPDGGAGPVDAGLPDAGRPDAGRVDAGAPDAGSFIPLTCEPVQLSCKASGFCANTNCTLGTTCDPADGQCKCGGPGGTVCGSGQACDVLVGACIGGDRCRGITCTQGASCDPEDGKCKCGGVGGSVCATDETCFRFATGSACRKACSPLTQNCAPNQACYIDQPTSVENGFCAAPGTKTGSGNPPPQCTSANDCAQGFHCEPEVFPNYPGTCRRYCDVAQGAGGCTGTLSCIAFKSGATTGPGRCK